MFTRGAALTSLLAIASTVPAGVRIDLVPTPNTADYMPGQDVQIDVNLVQDPAGSDHLLRLVQFDFAAPSNDAFPMITLGATHSMASINFWDFSSKQNCVSTPTMCGAGHFVDDDLPTGPGILGTEMLAIAYYFTDSTNLMENPAAQLTLPVSTAVRVGRMTVKMPSPAVTTTYTLDVINTGNQDANRGGVVYYGFGVNQGDPVTILRANNAAPNNLTGGTREFRVAVVPSDVMLVSSVPACDESLWRRRNNFVDLNFSGTIGLPGQGQVRVEEMIANGVREDVTSQFTFTIRPNGTTLRVQQLQGVNVAGRVDNMNPVPSDGLVNHRQWYRIRRNGWPGVADFQRAFVVQVGDADSNRQVNSLDVSKVNGFGTCFNVAVNCPEKIRGDVDGNNNLNSLDVSEINGVGTSFAVSKPMGHNCVP